MAKYTVTHLTTPTGFPEDATMATIRVVTRENASLVGEANTTWTGSWRNSVDNCDSDGHGRVFIDVADEDANMVEEGLETDDRVVSYGRV